MIALQSLLACAFCLAGLSLHADEFVTVTPADTGAALVNPAMGWTLHFYSNIPTNYGSKLEPSDTLADFPGLSTVYLRIPWAFLEPEEGRFNWAVLDTPAQRWLAEGKKIALRLTCSENWMKYATPEWVKIAGAKGTFYKLGEGRADDGPSWDPFFDDPVFLEKLDKFLAAAAARYDGNPAVEFIDVGTYGLWGEGHTFMSSDQDSYDIKKIHIDLHLKHFKNSLLCVSDDFAGHDNPGPNWPIMEYALANGVTLRDDSIMVQPPPRSWYHAEMAAAFWSKLPVVLEHEHYGASKTRNAWDPALFLRAVEDYHASFMSIHWWPRELLNDNREVIDAINRRIGYRIQPVEVTWPRVACIGKPFKVQWNWCNKGVAPCYPGGFPCLTLKDAKGGIVAVLSDETLNVRDLPIGPAEDPPVKEHESVFAAGLVAPTTTPGEYDVYVSVGARDGTPLIAMPLQNHDAQRRYRLGVITLADETNQ